ncbi:uncharacterized protein LOC112574745 isoform X1 [Pomacea canaliculata]|uniref:uncharacterized protein LOC112574745 isoform X1 n=2 Tax=Pomacea canaliculata TaxID=400727 RepID=UPI000D730905|nr:uncharacterized protein LOC112574745 isoform X1 [Pomacea canaliculata]
MQVKQRSVLDMSSTSEPESARQELEQNLQNYIVQTGDKMQGFLEWAAEHASRLYPDVGLKSYVVPPIFVHQHSSRYDHTTGADMMQHFQKSSPKGEKAHYYVTRAMDLLSNKLSQPLFIISGLEYDNMLKWVRAHPELTPHVPDDVEKRGDIDIMAIHPHHGLVFIQVKAVGDNPASHTDDNIKMRILQGGRQLRKDENVFRWVLQDWPEARDCRVTRVVALPNLSREEVTWPLSDLEPDSEESHDADGVLLMCKDDLPYQGPDVTAAETDVTQLLRWWETNVSHVNSPLPQKFMKDIVSRYVGLLSAVVVYTGNNIRREVRSKSEAADVCGMMFRRVLLNEQQKKILTQPCQRRYLSGPPGSGKTVLLTLRARQFVRQGGHVVVINMYRGAKGRSIGHFLAESVANFSVPVPADTKKFKGKGKFKKKKVDEKSDDSKATAIAQEITFDLSTRVHAVDVDISEHKFDKEIFLGEILRYVPNDVDSEDVMFIIDEIYVKDYWCYVLEALDTRFPRSVIWCAGLYSRNPPGFLQEDLFVVLRCPPSVQQVLHAVDWDSNRKTNYKLEPSDDGLFAAGLTPLSVRHGDHPQVTLTECSLCAEQLTFVLDDLLPRKVRCCRGLSWADVIMLVSIPRELYEPDSRGFLDTTRQDFDNYMAYLDTCPLVTGLAREKSR